MVQVRLRVIHLCPSFAGLLLSSLFHEQEFYPALPFQSYEAGNGVEKSLAPFSTVKSMIQSLYDALLSA